MASTSSMSVIAVLCFALARTSNGNVFLAKDVNLRGQPKVLSQAEIEQKFLDEVRGMTGKGPSDLQLPAIQAALEPMWNSLPKNQYGGLDNNQVRYALHRLFVQRHGWHIDGLGAADVSNTSSPAGVLKERVPAFLMDLFEEAFGQTGLKLHELSVFAGTLERLIHDENVDRLKKIYKALDVATDATMSADEADKTMQAFVVSFILGQDPTDAASVQKGIAVMQKTYPAWDAQKIWLDDLRQRAVSASPESEAIASGSGYGIELMENATEQVSMQLGGFLDKECRKMKDALLEVEEQSSGRVLLSNFYKKGMEKKMHFVEKPEYLRELGALDESQPGEPRVIVSNFIVSPNNCLFDTGFFSVCCQNECENVMGHLERSLGASEATPEQIIAVVADIPTTSVVAPRVLPQSMTVRLELVAERNGGKVPLYGRLFSQWLHFVFPHECPYPHVSGSTNPLTPDDYKKATSEKSSFGVSGMHKYINSVVPTTTDMSEGKSPESDSSGVDQMRWSDEEEILFVPAEAPRSFTGLLFRGAFALAVLAGVGVATADVLTRVGGQDSLLPKSEKSHIC